MCGNGSCGCGCGGASIIAPTGNTGASVTTPIYISNTVFVSKLGSNTTGTVERMDLPFLTITAAITAALTLTPASTKRVSIVVFGGTYTENITLANAYLTLTSGYSNNLLFDEAGYSVIASRYTTTKRQVYIAGTITVTADNINITGINAQTLLWNHAGAFSNVSHCLFSTAITTNNTAPNGSWYDVHSAIFLSLPSTGTLSGYYEKCTGGSTSFAGNSVAVCGNISGTLIQCVVDDTYGFASTNGNAAGTISGLLKKCKSTGAVSFASSNSSTGGTISGRLEDCISTANTSFSSSATGTAGTISGKLFRCKSIGGQKAFGFGLTGGTISGYLEDCYSDSGYSFGSFTTTGGTLSGVFIRCVDQGDEACFGSTEDGSGATLSGTFIDCIAKSIGFGVANGTGTAATLSARFENCIVHGTLSFGSSAGGTAGIISGTLTNCKGSGLAFCSSDTTGGTVSSTGQLINCTAIGDVMLRKAVVSGKVIGARINSQTANEPAIIVAGTSTAVLHNCKLKGNGSAASIHADSAINCTVTYCSTFGKGVHANVTNLVLSPFIIDESTEIF